MIVSFLKTLEEYHSLLMTPISVGRIMSKQLSCFAVVFSAQRFLLYAFRPSGVFSLKTSHGPDELISLHPWSTYPPTAETAPVASTDYQGELHILVPQKLHQFLVN